MPSPDLSLIIIRPLPRPYIKIKMPNNQPLNATSMALPNLAIREAHKKLGQQLKNATKSLEDELEAEHRKDYFFYVHNEMMKRQLNRSLNETVVEE